MEITTMMKIDNIDVARTACEVRNLGTNLGDFRAVERAVQQLKPGASCRFMQRVHSMALAQRAEEACYVEDPPHETIRDILDEIPMEAIRKMIDFVYYLADPAIWQAGFTVHAIFVEAQETATKAEAVLAWADSVRERIEDDLDPL
jgi:hypothetical protein